MPSPGLWVILHPFKSYQQSRVQYYPPSNMQSEYTASFIDSVSWCSVFTCRDILCHMLCRYQTHRMYHRHWLLFLNDEFRHGTLSSPAGNFVLSLNSSTNCWGPMDHGPIFLLHLSHLLQASSLHPISFQTSLKCTDTSACLALP